MATKNDITGDSLKSKASTKAYNDGWDRIFGNKKKAEEEEKKDEEKSVTGHQQEPWHNRS
jgi:hypothetical protein